MPPSPHATDVSPRAKLVEALVVFAIATSVAAVLYRVPGVGGYFHAVVAALFLYVPAAALWRRGRELDEYGLRARPLALNLGLYAALVALSYPPFAIGFRLWQGFACAHPFLVAAAPGPCLRGAAGALPLVFTLRWPPDLLRFAAAELLVVALPEEMFFRGYLLGRLDEVWPPARKLLGAPIGRGLLVSSVLFALCHLFVQGHPATLAVFFPALLFGWLRARTGSILAGTLFHASCNLYIEVLHRGYFG